MNSLLKYLGWLALLGTLMAPLLYYFDQLGEGGLRIVLVVSMAVWFVAAFIRDRRMV